MSGQKKYIISPKGGRIIDLTGHKYNRWTVLKLLPYDRTQTYWLCQCACGTLKEVEGYNLKMGKSKSCGCIRDKINTEHFKTHGLSGSKEHRAWTHMKDRCNNPNDKGYPHWGGRGITVCKRWMKFENFLKDMGSAPSPKHSIDRIDNDKGYSKKNCRWATYKQQGNNKRNNVPPLTYNGQTKTQVDWAEMLKIDRRTLWMRLRSGWSVEKTLSTPVRKLTKRIKT